jgi:hypothetical protein
VALIHILEITHHPMAVWCWRRPLGSLPTPSTRWGEVSLGIEQPVSSAPRARHRRRDD